MAGHKARDVLDDVAERVPVHAGHQKLVIKHNGHVHIRDLTAEKESFMVFEVMVLVVVVSQIGL